MNARIIIVGLVGIAIGAVVGVLGYVWVVGGSGEASEPISAPTLDINAIPTLNPTQAFEAATSVALLSTQVADLQATIESVPQEQPTTEPATAEPTEEPQADGEQAGGRVLYRIDPAASEVSFTLQEDLRGVRTTVVGTTNEVAGDVIIDMETPSSSTVGIIRVNARTLETDNSFRNRALRSEILQSAQDQYEFIEFTPISISGLPENAMIGETYEFEVTGDLPIISVTNEVTFTATITLESEDQISGTATTTIIYDDWGISIPSVPSVANVTEDATLTINFVANRVES